MIYLVWYDSLGTPVESGFVTQSPGPRLPLANASPVAWRRPAHGSRRKWLANLSFHRDFHPATFHQFAWCARRPDIGRSSWLPRGSLQPGKQALWGGCSANEACREQARFHEPRRGRWSRRTSPTKHENKGTGIEAAGGIRRKGFTMVVSFTSRGQDICSLETGSKGRTEKRPPVRFHTRRHATSHETGEVRLEPPPMAVSEFTCQAGYAAWHDHERLVMFFTIIALGPISEFGSADFIRDTISSRWPEWIFFGFFSTLVVTMYFVCPIAAHCGLVSIRGDSHCPGLSGRQPTGTTGLDCLNV